jgi:hypothetical protein
MNGPTRATVSVMREWTRARLRARIGLLAVLSPVLCAEPAQADLIDTGGAGIFLGYAFGQDGGFEWGLEAFATHYLNPGGACAEVAEHRTGVGPLMRVSAVGSRFQLTFAAHVGTELATTDGAFDLHSIAALDGEVGARIFLDEPSRQRVVPHTGVALEAAYFNFYLRQAWFLEAGEPAPASSLGGGARYTPTFGLPSTCARPSAVSGRPCRDHAGRQQRVGVRCSPRFDRRGPRAALWANRAADECASVPAFLQLALELLELDAPLELVRRAVAAADEELGHTRAALHLAGELGGGSVRLLPPPFRPRPSLPRRPALARLARESWVDGCLNEGLASTIATVEAARSTHAAEASASRRIAREEAGHAALANDVLLWALAESVKTTGGAYSVAI